MSCDWFLKKHCLLLPVPHVPTVVSNHFAGSGTLLASRRGWHVHHQYAVDQPLRRRAGALKRLLQLRARPHERHGRRHNIPTQARVCSRHATRGLCDQCKGQRRNRSVHLRAVVYCVLGRKVAIGRFVPYNLHVLAMESGSNIGNSDRVFALS